jgi:protein involved in polysaccharide export with SLBB domain
MFRSSLAAALILLGGCSPVALSEGPLVGSYVYRLGPGDRLKIQVFGEPSMSGDYSVSSEGMVAFPLLGELPASGKSLSEFKSDIVGRLAAQYLRDPQITLEMANFRPVFILGEVARPGEFAFTEGMSVFALVAKAGGYTYRANQGHAFIRREKMTAEEAIRVSSATAVQPGDTIRIPERTF